ncbi:proline-rich protein 2-like [Psammomys obesus]|uniref:proline-rich protein 2-like n=1 Tax=Psammomys obesus TaxID=48139 RepID=UPI002452963E|nr:proline-rich protein 2-like [Psammomys obesus]
MPGSPGSGANSAPPCPATAARAAWQLCRSFPAPRPGRGKDTGSPGMARLGTRTHVGIPRWGPLGVAGPSTPPAGPPRPPRFELLPRGLRRPGEEKPRIRARSQATGPAPAGRDPGQAASGPAASRPPRAGPLRRPPEPRAARPLPPPAGRGPRRAAQKA